MTCDLSPKGVESATRWLLGRANVGSPSAHTRNSPGEAQAEAGVGVGRFKEGLPVEESWGSGFVDHMPCSPMCVWGSMKFLRLEERKGPMCGREGRKLRWGPTPKSVSVVILYCI